MSIRVFTDSASDINQGELENVTVIPMTVTIDGKSYLDGVDITKDEFYTLLETSNTMPITSLISVYEFTKIFKKVKDAEDEAIVLLISSELSGTCQSAMIAAADFDNISVFDTKQVAAAQKLMVKRCVQLVNEGKSRLEIVAQLREEMKRLKIYASVDTLKYLQKGGRISKSSAIVGGIIGIKPLLTLEDGKLIAIGKARGSKQSGQFLNKKIEEFGGIDFSMPCAVGYSGTDSSNLMQYMENNQALVDEAAGKIDIVQIGTAVGTHAGPGTVLVTFFTKENKE